MMTFYEGEGDSKSWVSIASSADGRNLAVAEKSEWVPEGRWEKYRAGRIWTSQDAGTSWSQSAAPLKPWYSIASSSDGQILIATVYWWAVWASWGAQGKVFGGVYMSHNSGQRWKLMNLPDTGWNYVTSSVDGSTIAVASYEHMWVSTNSGTSWERKTKAALTEDHFLDVASSANGNRIVAVTGQGSIYTGTGGGGDMTENAIPGSPAWTTVASSADGVKLVAHSRLIIEGSKRRCFGFPLFPLF
jgi:hypothetical protein